MDKRVANIVPVLSLGDLLAKHGQPSDVPPQKIIEEVEKFGWRDSFIKLARLASVLANGSANVETELTTALIAGHINSPNDVERAIATYVASALNEDRRRRIAHEAGVYFLQAAVLLYGREDGPVVPDGTLAFWFLLANDHCFEWRAEDAVEVDRTGRIAVDIARALIFNLRRDPARFLVRMKLTLEAAPPRTSAWHGDDNWQAFLKRALGLPLDAYLETFALPLVMETKLWGIGNANIALPIVRPSTWLSQTQADATIAEGLLNDLALSRDGAQAELRKGLSPHGLPIGPATQYRYPFVRLAPDQLVAWSPQTVDEQLRGGIWGKCLAAAKQETGDGVQVWTSAFGDLFENYCRARAREAAAHPAFKEKLIMSGSVGDADEIEDVVIKHHDRIGLFSVKSSTVPEKHLRQATSRAEALAWFDKWLFAPAGKDASGRSWRAGVLPTLNAKVESLRRGAYEPDIPRDSHVFPVIVTYDDFGADNPSFYRWVNNRCREEGLFQQKRVRPITFAHVNEYEEMLAMASHGHRVITTLLEKTKGTRLAETPLVAVLDQICPDRSKRRLHSLEDEFHGATKSVLARLFSHRVNADDVRARYDAELLRAELESDDA